VAATWLDPAIELVTCFNAALNDRDVEAMMRCMTPDCVFENTDPAPEGTRYVGQAEVRGFWEAFFRGAAEARIDTEEIFCADDRCVMLWTYRWVDLAGQPGHVRGVDVYRLRGGLIAEKLSYVKG
jgi:ketosteroid isomerase-like protein